MESSSDYKILRFCLLKEDPKTNFILINKINTVDDNDYNVILSMSNEIYIKEFDKILKINNINSVLYDSETKTQSYDNKIEYTLTEKTDDIIVNNEINNTLENQMYNIKQKYENTVVEPIVETIVETIVEPIVEPVVESVVESVVEPIVEPIVEIIVEPIKKYRLKLKRQNKLLNILNDTSTETSEIENKVQYHLKLITSSTDIDTNNIIIIVTKLVKFIDNFTIEGIIKKKIIISTITKFLSEQNNNQWEEHQNENGITYWWNKITDDSSWTKPISNIDYIINTICPSLIDILISVDKREITLRKKPSCCFVS